MKKIITSLIAFCMLFSVMQTAVSAGNDAFVISKDTVSVGETFNVSFTLPGSVRASSLGVNFTFDREAFEITNIAHTDYSDLQPYLPGCNEAGNVAISWCDPTFDANTDISAGTLLLSVDFKVKKSAPSGTKVFEVIDYNVTGKFNDDTLMPEMVTPDGGTLIKSVKVISKNASGGSSSGSTTPSKPEKEEVKEDVNKPVTGWVKDGNNWHYYANGTMKTGWLNDNGTWYLLDNTTGAMKTGWVKDGNTWYFMKSSGAMATGWVKDGNAWYFMKSSGAMATGWVKDGNTWYFMKSSGAMATGWLNDNGTWYYLNSSGAMVTNTVVDGYTIDANGVWVQ